MKESKGLEKLINLARRGRPESCEPAPPGFTTRIVARAWSNREEDPLVIWERMARWCLAVAVVACLATVALHHPHSPRLSGAIASGDVNEPAENLW